MTNAREVPLFSIGELYEAISLLNNGKARGNHKSNRKVAAIDSYRQYNVCLTNRLFSKRRKIARLISISKEKGAPNSPSAYWTPCLLKTLLVRLSLAELYEIEYRVA